jgi:hypothetical protein
MRLSPIRPDPGAFHLYMLQVDVSGMLVLGCLTYEGRVVRSGLMGFEGCPQRIDVQ